MPTIDLAKEYEKTRLERDQLRAENGLMRDGLEQMKERGCICDYDNDGNLYQSCERCMAHAIVESLSEPLTSSDAERVAKLEAVAEASREPTPFALFLSVVLG